MRLERAHAIRKGFRKHRDGAIREVNGGAAETRLPVESALRSNVMRYIGDVNFGIHYNANSVSHCTAGNWYHIAGTYDGSNLRLYFNGVLEDTESAPSNFRTRGQNINIGARFNRTFSFNGQIDELTVHNAALNVNEIVQALATHFEKAKVSSVSGANSR